MKAKRIRLTKLEMGTDNRFLPPSYGIPTVGSVWEGEQSQVTPQPIVGKPFLISTYKTSLVQKIL
jgi:hypothetical protein